MGGGGAALATSFSTSILIKSYVLFGPSIVLITHRFANFYIHIYYISEFQSNPSNGY